MKAFLVAIAAAFDLKRVAVWTLSFLAVGGAVSAQVAIGPAPVGPAQAGAGSGTTSASPDAGDDNTDPLTGLPKTYEQRHPAPPRQKFNPLFAPASPPKPNEDAVIPPPDLSKIKQGYGWCRITDDENKVSYYSTLIPGNPDHETKPRNIAFRLYLQGFYPNIPFIKDDAIYCYWNQFSADYSVTEMEKQDAYYHLLQNYDVKMTSWHP